MGRGENLSVLTYGLVPLLMAFPKIKWCKERAVCNSREVNRGSVWGKIHLGVLCAAVNIYYTSPLIYILNISHFIPPRDKQKTCERTFILSWLLPAWFPLVQWLEEFLLQKRDIRRDFMQNTSPCSSPSRALKIHVLSLKVTMHEQG